MLVGYRIKRKEPMNCLGGSVPILVLPLSLMLSGQLFIKEQAEVAESLRTGHLN